MARKRTSKAIRRTIYLNPKADARQEWVVNKLLELESEDYNISQIFVERMMRYEDIDPALLPSHQQHAAQVIIAEMHAMFEQYTDAIMNELKRRGVKVSNDNGDDLDDYDDDGVSKFAKNFARGFIKRQQQGE